MNKLVTLLILSTLSWGGCNKVIAETNVVKNVAVVTVPPFVYENGTGLDIDLISKISAVNNWDTKINYYPTMKELLESVKSGESDFGISGITINHARESNGLDFSHPYYLDGGIKIMTHVDSNALSINERASIAWPTIKRMIVVLFIIVTILAHAVWLREGFNGDNNNFHSNYFIGIFEAYYWAIVTSSTVGYGDITAKTVIGRLLTIFAIIVGLTWFADFMSDMSAVKTIIVEQKSEVKLSDLNGEKVATIANTTSQEILGRYQGIETVLFTDIKQACKAVANKEVYALIYDAPVLQHFAASDDSVYVSEAYIAKENYGIVLKEGSELKEVINCNLLEFLEDGRYDKMKRNWFTK